MSHPEANDLRRDPDGGQTQPAEAPGIRLGKIGMILAIIPFTAFVGLVCSVLGLVLSRQVGEKNGKATIGILVGVVWLIIGVVVNSLFFTQR